MGEIEVTREFTHCSRPMEVLRMPDKSPIAPGQTVGVRCTDCHLVVPNVLLHTLKVDNGTPSD